MSAAFASKDPPGQGLLRFTRGKVPCQLLANPPTFHLDILPLFSYIQPITKQFLTFLIITQEGFLHILKPIVAPIKLLQTFCDAQHRASSGWGFRKELAVFLAASYSTPNMKQGGDARLHI